MKNVSRRHFLAMTGAAVAAIPHRSQAAPTTSFLVKLIVPAYIYPSAGAWNPYINAHNPANGVYVTLIANQNNGTFTAADPNFTTAINAAVAKGVTVLGYVHTTYGTRASASVDTDVSNWLKYYPKISGFFVDEQATGANELSYYQSLYTYIRQHKPGAFIMGNPGTTCDVRYLVYNKATMANTLVLWENDDKVNSFTGFSVPKAFQQYGAEAITAIIYDSATLKYILGSSGARAKGVGYIFVTNGSGGNPYGIVPSYWTSGEVPDIAITNKGA